MMSIRISRLMIVVFGTMGLVWALLAAENAQAESLSASLRDRVEQFLAERAGGSVESILVPPLGGFELDGVDPKSVRIDLSTRARGRLSGAVAVNVVLSDNDRVLKRGVVTAEVRTRDRVWVAARDLDRGTRVTRDDLRLARVDTRSIPEGATSDPDALIGLQLRRSLRQGSIVRTRYVEVVPIVSRGQTVPIVLQRMGLVIIGKGRAVSDGAVGEHIRVVNTDSKREVTGRVAEDGSVHVDL